MVRHHCRDVPPAQRSGLVTVNLLQARHEVAQQASRGRMKLRILEFPHGRHFEGPVHLLHQDACCDVEPDEACAHEENEKNDACAQHVLVKEHLVHELRPPFSAAQSTLQHRQERTPSSAKPATDVIRELHGLGVAGAQQVAEHDRSCKDQRDDVDQRRHQRAQGMLEANSGQIHGPKPLDVGQHGNTSGHPKDSEDVHDGHREVLLPAERTDDPQLHRRSPNDDNVETKPRVPPNCEASVVYQPNDKLKHKQSCEDTLDGIVHRYVLNDAPFLEDDAICRKACPNHVQQDDCCIDCQEHIAGQHPSDPGGRVVEPGPTSFKRVGAASASH
mmetsp:Transcript_137388/g.325420  ORF Transcript_137388/g.325420 Transcript_137388/m.325420 type:complete len:331 (-) Transcript_137388:217-1209(-)